MMNVSDNNIFSFVANATQVKVHSHHCLQIVVSLDNPYDCSIAGQTLTNNRGFLINQRVPHSCQAPQSQVLVLIINSAGVLGYQLKSFLKGRDYIDLKEIISTNYLDSILPLDFASLPPAVNQQWVAIFLDRILRYCGETYIPRIHQDDRVKKALDYIETHIDQHLTLKQLAEVMHLSIDRARHLFLETMGSPFVQYMLWLRIRKILLAVKYQHMNFATACVHYGFTDQPHFNRIFKKMYGVAPATLLKVSLFI